MENNIFEGAKFGDRFITKNNTLAIYIGKDEEKIAEQEKKINELDETLNIKFRSPYESHP